MYLLVFFSECGEGGEREVGENTYLTRLRHTESIGFRKENILWWISGGTARNGTVCFVAWKRFHASLATGSCATASCMITSFDLAGAADIDIVVFVVCCVEDDIALGMLCVFMP